MRVVIIETLGRYSDGVLILIKISMGDKFYDAVFFYNSEEVFIETGEDFQNDWGLIDENPHYEESLRELLTKLPAWEDIVEEIIDLEEVLNESLKNNLESDDN